MGLAKILSLFPASITFPKYITAKWSHIFFTSARLWEIKTYVKLSFSCNSSKRLRIWAWMLTSRAETGSSQTKKLGLRLMARAIPKRWRCPPEKSEG